MFSIYLLKIQPQSPSHVQYTSQLKLQGIATTLFAKHMTHSSTMTCVYKQMKVEVASSSCHTKSGPYT